MNKIYHYVLADQRIKLFPDNPRFIGGTAYMQKTVDNVEYIYGYLSIHAEGGFWGSIVYKLKAKEPLLYGCLDGEMFSADPSFEEHKKLFNGSEQLRYSEVMSEEERDVHESLFKAFHDRWFVNGNATERMFRLERLKDMSVGVRAGVEFYQQKDRYRKQVLDALEKADLPVDIQWIPLTHEEALEAYEAEQAKNFDPQEKEILQRLEAL
ncbi:MULTISPECIES: hypothetical protein [unclassified Pseudodesulfovibrio]|uniref:hypothetical protein n=1 Tax=unclassified Pseudodesulfovibrio TaxID=2661612 RepID=UPI000FEC0857|nr:MULTISPECIES: hypothetical protein [unclassified Pseudodesulfovibrio]MCJ2163544.1 hypothetical protein [Pseudodesulfovibrio sp. S3-i]RWU06780.1 hypothetical protein DWB63_03175 [Pseudodesulfovibrio sp. S3]